MEHSIAFGYVFIKNGDRNKTVNSLINEIIFSPVKYDTPQDNRTSCRVKDSPARWQ
jgi:hypothetical protein